MLTRQSGGQTTQSPWGTTLGCWQDAGPEDRIEVRELGAISRNLIDSMRREPKNKTEPRQAQSFEHIRQVQLARGFLDRRRRRRRRLSRIF